jgi:signal transduction histidine kinase
VGRADIRKETLDMDGLVRQVAEQLRPQLENKRINLDIRPLPVVVAPALPMKQIFGNLLSNAIKYMGDSPERRIEVGGDRDEKEIRLYVRDTGIGIDPAYHDRIFIIFQRLKELEDVKGTGVGLAIVKKIVENLNGTISVESEKGKGATFTVTFPVLTAS